MSKDIFKRPLTNPEKAALILHLLDIGLPSWGETEDEDLVHVYCGLTGQDYEAGKRAFLDAARFGYAHINEGGLDA